MHSLSDYDYILPSELIAQTPADPPESCRFLVVDRESHQMSDHIFSDLPDLIDPDTLIVFNNSKVLKARLILPDWWEIFYLSSNDEYRFSALVRPGKRFKVWSTIKLNNEVSFLVESISDDGRILVASQPIFEILESHGQMPLPPYIAYDESLEDPYQPVFASTAWSVAAPTASLHFTDELIRNLESKWVQSLYTTLHVWLGTFKPVNVESIISYDIHSERIEVDSDIWSQLATAKQANKNILAVGTTVTRTLESLPYLWKMLEYIWKTKDATSMWYRDSFTSDITFSDAKKIIWEVSVVDEKIFFDSKLFLYPGKKFYIIDELITNFHLPKSSLLMLVAGLVWYDQMREIYKHAIDQQYRFYSFGDAMWLKKTWEMRLETWDNKDI